MVALARITAENASSKYVHYTPIKTKSAGGLIS